MPCAISARGADSVDVTVKSTVPVTAAVWRLPPEIICIIFFILSSINPPELSRHYDSEQGAYSRPRSHLGWLTIVHVCRRWRHIAFNHPALWAANIIVPFPLGDNWAAIYHSRAQHMALTIQKPSLLSGAMRLPSPTRIERAFMRQNLARTHILRLELTPNTLPILCLPAPHLHTLEITGAGFHNSHLPHDLLGREIGAPRLRHLSLRGSPGSPWTSPLLRHLVTLDIESGCPNSNDSITDIVAALGRMLALERLVMCLRDPKILVSPPPIVVALANLRHLGLRAKVVTVGNFMEHLALPAGVVVRCDLQLGFWNPVCELATFFPAMIACIDARAAPITRIDIEATTQFLVNGEADAVGVTAWRTGEADVPDQAALTLRIRKYSPIEHRWDLVPVLGALVSEHLEELSVCIGKMDPAWPQALRKAPVLRRVTFDVPAARAFCAALDGDPCCFPALTALAIRGADFFEAYQVGRGVARTLATSLLMRLAERARAGFALKELTVTECKVDDAFVQKVQEEATGLAVTWCQEEKRGCRPAILFDLHG
ncbi:hypothetical protein FA95DRAFT_1574028 [Auriscalpium vulgare]|uniref:Uncharacterized protein n=1 Tax=Auriscalpium vulgare TaxID=40419 RepID=A0ACB8RM02_9AGAM|nr:hypothetical protein FA95DRAFT_1574028 [Auriscalpium vulgare]